MPLQFKNHQAYSRNNNKYRFCAACHPLFSIDRSSQQRRQEITTTLDSRMAVNIETLNASTLERMLSMWFCHFFRGLDTKNCVASPLMKGYPKSLVSIFINSILRHGFLLLLIVYALTNLDNFVHGAQSIIPGEPCDSTVFASFRVGGPVVLCYASLLLAPSEPI